MVVNSREEERGAQPLLKKCKLSLGSRFNWPKSEEEMREILKGFVPQNTANSKAWGVRVFQDWRSEFRVSSAH